MRPWLICRMGQLYKNIFNPTPTDEQPFAALTDRKVDATIFIRPSLEGRHDPQQYGFAWNRPRDGEASGAIEDISGGTHLRIRTATQMIRRGLLSYKPLTQVMYEAGQGTALPESVGMDKLSGAERTYLYVGTVEELLGEVKRQIDSVGGVVAS